VGLRIDLKPGERIIIGASAIQNQSATKMILGITGSEPVLRSKHVLTLETANTPAKLIYFAIQSMLISDNPEKIFADYERMVDGYLGAAPSVAPLIEEMRGLVAEKRYYQALLKARELIDREGSILGSDEPQNA
jgi:flagellar protein FlbT